MHHINQFRSVVALAEHRHFGQAAAAIGLTQSALSQNIRKVEDLYGVELFARRNRQISLTAYGEVVYKSARQSLAALENARRELSLLQNLESGHLVIGVDPYFASSLMAPALCALLNDHPQLKFTIRTGYWADFEQGLLRDEVDLYFGMLPASQDNELNYQLLELPTPLILCHPDHPFATRNEIRFRDTLDHRIVTPLPPAWFADWAVQQLESSAANIAFDNLMILEADNIEVVKQVAKHSVVLIAAMRSDVLGELRRGELLALKLKNWPATMQGCITTRTNRTLPPAADALKLRLARTIEASMSGSD